MVPSYSNYIEERGRSSHEDNSSRRMGHCVHIPPAQPGVQARPWDEGKAGLRIMFLNPILVVYETLTISCPLRMPRAFIGCDIAWKT